MGKGFSAKNCIDTRGGWERGRQRGGRGEGGLSRCNVAQSVCQRQAHHKISQSVCQSVLWGVAHGCVPVFTTLGYVCVCERACASVRVYILPLVISSCRSEKKSDHTLLKFSWPHACKSHDDGMERKWRMLWYFSVRKSNQSAKSN